MGLRFLVKSKVKRPGLHGGKYWIDKQGNVQYGEKPTGRKKEISLEQKRFKKTRIEPEEYKKHGIPEGSKHVHVYEGHKVYTHEWRDKSGKLQRRYNPEFIEKKQAEKYKRIEKAIHRIPELREAVNNDLNSKDRKKKFTALAVRIIDLTGARVGTEIYIKEQGTHGVTTLEKKNLYFRDNIAVLDYTGKKQVHQVHEIDDLVTVEALRELKKYPGKRLFQIDKEGNISADGVNKYLKDYEITAKDLRTFRANVEFTKFLRQAGSKGDEKSRMKIIAEALKNVAGHLGNTANVCRTNYISPGLLNGFLEGKISLKFAVSKSYDVGDYDELFDEDEMAFIEVWGQLKDSEKGNKKVESEKELNKSYVKGHTRTTEGGKTVQVRPYTTIKVKHEKPVFQDMLIDKIIRDESQPREKFDRLKLKELGESIKTIGLVQPIGIRKIGEGKYKIIFGERRWRAARLAGIRKLPTKIFDIKDRREIFAIQVAENLGHEDMNPIETANACKKLFDIDMTYEEIAKEIGVSPLTVQRKITLTTLIPEIKELIINGDLSESNGIIIGLAGLRNQFQFDVLKKIKSAGKRLSKEELSGIVGRYKQAQSQTSMFGATTETVQNISQVNKNKVEALKRKADMLIDEVLKMTNRMIDDKNYKLIPAILKERGRLRFYNERLKLLIKQVSKIQKEVEGADSYFKAGGSIEDYLGKQGIKKEKRRKRKKLKGKRRLKKSIIRFFLKSRTGVSLLPSKKDPRVKRWQRIGDAEKKFFKKPLTEYQIRSNVERAGAKYIGAEHGLVYFNITTGVAKGATLVLELHESTLSRIKQKIAEKEEVFRLGLLVKKAQKYNSANEFYRNILGGESIDYISDLKLPLTENERFSLSTSSLYKKADPENYVRQLFRKTFEKKYGSLTEFYKKAVARKSGIKKSIRFLIKSKKYPVGHVSIYRDGSVWKKVSSTGNSDRDWKELKGDAKIRAKKTLKRPGIGDFGEKIGGARKDTAERGYRRGRIKKKVGDDKIWRKKYVTLKKVDGSGWIVGKVGDKYGFATSRDKLFSTEKEAKKAIPLYAVADSHRVFNDRDNKDEFAIYKKVGERKLFKVVNKTFRSREEALKYMANHAEEILDIKTTFGEEILPCPEIAIRTGVHRRDNDTTPKMFLKKFHPRGIEFGNWNNQDERQQVLNHAYDGLLDLAEVLHISPYELMLSGELAIAFGARGQGLSGARAHYERDYGVINLTKMKGAGALAHEYFHALDHYFARKDTKASSGKIKNERGDSVYKISSTRMDFLSHGESYRTKLKPEIIDGHKKLMQTMYKKAEKYVEDKQQADKFVGKAREQLKTTLNEIRRYLESDLSKTYTWRKSKKGLLPASAEQLAEFDKMAKKLLKGGDRKIRYILPESPDKRRSIFNPGHQSNDTIESISKIYKEIRNRSGFDSQHRTGALDRLAASLGIYDARLQMFEDAINSTEKTKSVPTSYAIEAKKMDQARTSDYWSEPHEMAARAFSSYVEDKITKKGNQSDFIVYQAHGGILLPMLDGFIAKPYPEGNERTTINRAFDNLFKVIRKNKELKKSLFRDF